MANCGRRNRVATPYVQNFESDGVVLLVPAAPAPCVGGYWLDRWLTNTADVGVRVVGDRRSVRDDHSADPGQLPPGRGERSRLQEGLARHHPSQGKTCTCTYTPAHAAVRFFVRSFLACERFFFFLLLVLGGFCVVLYDIAHGAYLTGAFGRCVVVVVFVLPSTYATCIKAVQFRTPVRWCPLCYVRSLLFDAPAREQATNRSHSTRFFCFSPLLQLHVSLPHAIIRHVAAPLGTA